jgi:hypothetical protein
MNTTPKKYNGCLWIFIFGLVSLFGWILISSFFNVNSYISGIGAMVIAAFLTSKWLGKPSLRGLLINVSIIFLLIAGLRFISSIFLDTITQITEETDFRKEEGVGISTIIEEQDTVNVFSSHRIWRDNYGNDYEGDLTIREKDYVSLQGHLGNWNFKPGSGHFWGTLYDYLDQTDTPSLDLVMDAFQKINTEKKLNQMEFAEMVVSCIQDIPYSFVFQEECLPAENYEASIRSILEECPDCCLGNIPYGIQNPVSFLKNLKGDCDTRTVLIYSILKYYNYDVAILNSEFYRHSIIGINLPANGVYKLHYGKKYVVWETTAKYFEAGTLPNNFKDITHWNVILTSK